MTAQPETMRGGQLIEPITQVLRRPACPGQQSLQYDIAPHLVIAPSGHRLTVTVVRYWR